MADKVCEREEGNRNEQGGKAAWQKKTENNDTEQMLDRVDIISDITGEVLK